MHTTKLKRAKKPKTRADSRINKTIDLPQRRLVIPRPDVLHTYLEYSQVNQYLDYIAKRYSNFVKIYTLGTTHEKREVRAIEINWMNADNNELSSLMRIQAAKHAEQFRNSGTKGPMVLPGDKNRNIIFIEAGTHAREWITVSTSLNCIYQLTERYTRNIEVLRNLRFIIVPLVNPDGYEYSRTKNRSWRKNRRPHKSSKFVGTDCNRNYDIFWETGPTKLNRNTFKGDCPFSELETRAMRNFLHTISPNLLFFLSLHSYGQSIMYPWGYCREAPYHWRELHTLATTGRAAIKSYNGREYRTGSISGLTKRTITGSVVDYVYGILKAPVALVMELPSRELGFQPPVEMISQIGHESWFGIREMCKSAFDLRQRICRDDDPVPPKPQPKRLQGGGDSLSSANSNESDKKTTPKKKTKKRPKRTVITQHTDILDLQKRHKKATIMIPKRPLTAPMLTRVGQGDGPF